MKLSNEIRSKVCGEKFTRDFKLVERAAVEEDDRTIKLSFASEEPYERWWGVEIIDMQKMDLKRLQTGAALLLNHDHSYRNGHIGRIEKAWIDGDLIGRAEVRFSKRDLAEEVLQDIRDGILDKVSFGYEITDFELVKEAENKNEKDVYRVATTPYEISVVHTPADLTVSIEGAKSEEKILVKNVQDLEDGIYKTSEVVNVSASVDEANNNNFVEVSEMENVEKTVETIDKDKVAAEAKAAYKAYCSEVKELCKLAGFGEKADGFIDSETKIEDVRKALIDAKAKAEKEEVAAPRVEIDDSNILRRAEARTKNLANVISKGAIERDAASQVHNLESLTRELAKENGVDTSFMGKAEVLDLLLTRDHSTSDFPKILQDAVNKSLLASYDSRLAVQTFRPLVRERQVADYKDIPVVRLGETPALEEKAEGEEVKFGTLSEAEEKYKLVDYAKGLSLTDRAIRNDDLSAFSSAIVSFGSSAARKESELFYDELVNGTVDGSAIYSAPRGNLLATNDIDIAGLSAVRTALMKQTGLDASDPLNLTMSYVIVPPELMTAAQQFSSSAYVPDQSGNINPFSGAYMPISDARLTDSGAWYAATDLGQTDLFEIAYLSGMRAPMVGQRVNWMTESVQVKVKHSFAIKVIDYRGLVKSTLA